MKGFDVLTGLAAALACLILGLSVLPKLLAFLLALFAGSAVALLTNAFRLTRRSD